MLLQLSKKFLLLVYFLVFSLFTAIAQPAVGDFKSNAAGNWNAGATWLKCVTLNTWVGATATAPTGTAADGVITVSHAVTVTVSVTQDQVTVATGGTITVNNAITFNLADGAGTDLQIDAGGTFRCFAGTATLTINTNADVVNNGTLAQTVTTAIINNNGIITNSGTITSTLATNFKFLANSIYRHNFTSLAATVGVIPSSTWNATSTCEILACGNTGVGPTGLAQAFGHFIWNNSTQPSDIAFLGTMSTATAGNFTLNNTGGFNLILSRTTSGSGSGTTTIGGNFILNSGNITVLKATSINYGQTLRVNGNYTQNGGVMTISDCSGTFGANSTNGVLNVAGTSSIVGGIMNVATGTWTGANGNGTFQSTGLITLSTAATINGCSSTAIGGTGILSTISADGGITINAGGTLNLNTATTTGTGGSTTLTANGLTTLSGGIINGSSAVGTGITSCNSTVQANSGLTISSGTLNLTPGNIIGGGGVGFINVTGALTINGGTININSSTATGGTTGSTGSMDVSTNCTISGSSLINITSSTTTGGGGSGTLNVAGAFSMSSGTLNVCSTSGAGTGDGLLNVDGNFSLSGTAVFNLTSSATTASGFGKGTLNVAGTFSHTTAAASFARTATLAASLGTVNIDGTAAFTQTLQSNSGFSGTITFNISQAGSASAVATIPTSFVINSGTTVNINDNSANAVDLTVAAAATFTNNGVVNLNFDAELDMVGNVAMTGSGNFIMITDATLLTQHTTGISSTAGLGCIQVVGTKTFAADGNYTYYGTAAQVTGDGLPVSITGILNIANSLAPATGGVTLTRATTILFGPNGGGTNGQLSFGGTTNGRLITTLANIIILGDDVTASPIGGAAAKFVDGPIKKIGNDLFIFPTGDVYQAQLTYPTTTYTSTAKWARIEISAPTNTTDEFIAEYHKVDDPCNVSQVVSLTNGVGINNVSWKEYWDLTRTSAAAVTPTVKLYWQNGSVAAAPGTGSAISLLSDLRVAECITSTWTNKTGTVTTTGTVAGPGTIISTIATTFTTNVVMPFTFGSAAGVNPLPVELLTFTGTAITEGNQIDWSTATETNSDYFDLERSSDGNYFETIYTAEGQGTSTSLVLYNYLDAAPLPGMNYYRLNQVDFDGRHVYSDIISVDRVGYENATVNVYPNPSNDLVNIISSENMTSITIYNMLGEIVFISTSEEKNFQFNPILKGIYLIKATSKDGKETAVRFVRN